MSPILALFLAGGALVSEAQAAELTGTIRERGTGDPIEGAWVQWGEVQVFTDRAGAFALDLPDGRQELTLASPSHLPQSLVVDMPQSLPLEVWLHVDDGPLEIVVEARSVSPHVSRPELDRERVLKTPGTHADPLRLIQALPGVALTPEYSPSAGSIAIRGSAPAESRIYLDDVELPYLYHFQEYASVIHTRLLDEVAVYPSTYGAAYGNSTGGIVRVKTREIDPVKLHGGANVNFIMGGAYLTSPVGEGAEVAASGRRSYLDAVEDGNDQYTLWPVFWDYLGQVELNPGADQRYRLSAIGAGDAYGRYAGDTALLDPLEQEDNPSFDYQRAFHGLIFQARNRTGALQLRTTLGAVTDGRTGNLPQAAEERREDYAILRHETQWVQDDVDRLSTGVDLKLARVDRMATGDQARPELSREAPMLARGLPVSHEQVGLTLEPWFEPRLHLGKTRIQLGARGLVDTASSSWTVDPRLGVQSELAPDVRLRAATGRYSQAPALDLHSPVDGLPDLGLASSEQVAAGVDWAVAGRLELALDLWGKRLHDTWTTDAAGAPLKVDGEAAGIELQTRYRLRERFFSWATLTLGRARRDGLTFAYDQPVALNLVASWEATDSWTLGVRYRWGSGLPFTPVTGSTYDGDSDGYVAQLGTAYSDRLPAYQKLDLQIDRTWTFRTWSLGAYLALWWVPPAGNVLYPAWSYDYGEVAWVKGPPVLPLLGVHADI